MMYHPPRNKPGPTGGFAAHYTRDTALPMSHWVDRGHMPLLRERLDREGLDGGALVRESDDGVAVATILDRAAIRGVRRDAWRSAGAYDPAQWPFDGRAEGGHLIFAEMALGTAADIGAAARCVPLSDSDEPGHIACRVDRTRCDADAAAPEQQC